ncbi:MAG TPA: class I SAM-dependent methyltransferase [Hanamia sp.]|nr:class I SAM-dependent methyltransferase [Hanamia sp.]
MNSFSLHELIGNTDIYLLDQIMKGGYIAGEKILDTGCGNGRNLIWFLKNDFEVYAVDRDPAAIKYLESVHPDFNKERLQVAEIDKLPFGNNFFDHVISSAVLHFAKSVLHFNDMIKEMVRVLKPNGSLFIRMTSDIGIENKIQHIENGVYHIPDGSIRFLLTPNLLKNMMYKNNLSFIEPLKTVNVDGLRCMSTLVLRKKYEFIELVPIQSILN